MKANILAPSILSADFANLGRDMDIICDAGAQYVHLDIMDGIFVPSISFGMPVVRSIRQHTPLTLDVHLMISDPDRYLEDFADAGADIITVHAEACTHLDRTLNSIHALGLRAGVALNPSTALSAIEWVAAIPDQILLMSVNPGFGGQAFIPYVLKKIRLLSDFLDKRGLETDIEVDGGINLKNCSGILSAGANVIVAGSSIFNDSIEANIAAFLRKMS